MARKTLCTPERTKRIADIIRAGNYAEIAARVGGISEATYYNWINRGESGEEPYVEFLESIKAAEAESEARNIALIQRSAQNGTWQAAAWFLERKHGTRWGRRQAVEVSGNTSITLSGLAEMLRDEDEPQDETQDV